MLAAFHSGAGDEQERLDALAVSDQQLFGTLARFSGAADHHQ